MRNTNKSLRKLIQNVILQRNKKNCKLGFQLNLFRYKIAAK